VALPVSTPPNALAHATGELDRRDFLETAGLIGLVGALLIFLMFGLVRPWLPGAPMLLPSGS
jgi:sodium-dependent dicarboxylate transporter 2/3/5